MPLRARLLPYLLLLAATLAAPLSHAQQQRLPIYYTIEDGDTLWIIAALYYNAPTAGGELYKLNKAVIDASNKNQQKDARWIFPGTVIELPARIRSGDILYTRRARPMDRTVAIAVGRPDGIDMTELLSIARAHIFPKYIKPNGNVQPFAGYVPVSRASKAKRERTPSWFKKPASGLEQCAKAVCARFEQLCFFECLAVAKRLSDGDDKIICSRLQENSRNMSVQIPYEVDEETRDSCAELVQ